MRSCIRFRSRATGSMSASERAAATDLITQTYQRLRELIVSGRLAPGTRIVESELAERLSVSRTPVRSALHRLQQEGWILGTDTGRQLRLSVAPLTQEDARELYEIIGAIEGLAARRAAAAPEAERRRLAAELTSLNESMRAEAASESPDPQRVFELHSAFHVGLVGAVAAPRLRALLAAIKPQSDRYRRIYSSALVPVAREAAAEQEAVIRAIGAGDGEAAEGSARANWSNAAERMSRIIEAAGERGSW